MSGLLPNPPCVLTVAGSDSGGGAGIQADLKTFMMQACYGLSVITALTAQNTRGVSAIEAPSPEFVARQLQAVLSDFPIRAAKTGMLFSAPIIEAVAEGLSHKDFPLVVDPVCVAQSGARLLLPQAVDALKARIFPLADLLTPNRHEAELLSGVPIASPEDAHEAMERLLGFGAKAVLLKGGHFDIETGAGEAVRTDRLLTADGRQYRFVRPHVTTSNTHGTGCTLSAAIAAHLALGKALPEAVDAARDFLQLALRASYDLGGGEGPVHHLTPFVLQRHRLEALEALAEAGATLAGLARLDRLLPERDAHLVVAVPLAETPGDVASLPLCVASEARRLAYGAVFGQANEAVTVALSVAPIRPGGCCVLTLRHDAALLSALEAMGVATVPFAAFALGDAATTSGVKQDVSGDDWGAFAILASGGSDCEPRVFLVGPEPDAVLGCLRTLGERLD